LWLSDISSTIRLRFSLSPNPFTMRTLIPILLCFLSLFALRAHAQETFAPLITENTFIFVHVNLGNVDIDAVKAETMKLGETFLNFLGFDARSKTATLRDLESELEKLDAMVRPAWELITKEFGIQEIASINDLGFAEQEIQMIVLPWKGKNDADVRKLLSFLPEGEYQDTFFIVGDFLLLPTPYHNFFSEEQVAVEWATNAHKSNDSPILKALKSLNNSDDFRMIVAFPEKFKEEAKRELQEEPPPDLTEQTERFAFFVLEKVEWITYSFSYSDMLTGSETKNVRSQTIKMSSADDAKMFRKMIEEMIDTSDHAVSAEISVPPLFMEFLKGYMRTWLPEVEGDTLVLTMSKEGFVLSMWTAAPLILLARWVGSMGSNESR